MQKLNPVLVKYSVAQTFYQIGTVMVMAVGALSGRTIAPSPDLATLPLALSVVGTLIGLFPAAWFMGKWGRRAGFGWGSALGLAGAATIVLGLVSHSFALFSLGFLLYGLHQSFIQFLRFAAMEAVEPSQRAHALSWVLVAGVPAAFLGPLVGLIGFQLFPQFSYAGSYLFLFGALALQLVVLLTTSNSGSVPTGIGAQEEARPLKSILRQPDLWLAIAASGLGFALMVMLMAAVPIAMKSHGHAHSDSTLVLQWHVLGMYLPSFFSGFLIQKLGKKWLILIGIVLMASQALIAMLGFQFAHFAIALILLGIGWNFMYVGGTNLLVEQYRPSEKGKIQAINDTIVFGLAAVATYGAGFLESKIGWFSMNVLILPIVGAALVFTAVSLRKKSQTL